MKILFIGGTGTISTAISRRLLAEGHDLYLVNRGSRNNVLGDYENLHSIICDVNDEVALKAAVDGITFDSVCDFIGFTVDQVERDYRVFKGITKQYMYISSASAYSKPCKNYKITEGTVLDNKFWQYSRDKIVCEEYLLDKFRKENFPITIIRPSHTYDERNVPLGAHGRNGAYQVVKRMMEGKQVLVHGDGTSLWHMTFNEDFAKGFVGLICNQHAIGEVFQITNDETLTWNQIYQTIADYLGVEYKPYYVASDFLASTSDFDFRGGLLGDKAHSVVFDNTKLKRVVPGLNMNISFREGIGRTLDYILSHPECQIEDPEFDAYTDAVIEELEAAKEKLRNRFA